MHLSANRYFFILEVRVKLGKAKLLKLLLLAWILFFYKDEVILIAPIGAAADNISGNIYYTVLGISLAKI